MPPAPFTPSVDAGAWHAELEQNLTSVFYCLKFQIPAMTGSAAAARSSTTPRSAESAAYPAWRLRGGQARGRRPHPLGRAGGAARGVRVNALVTGNVDTPLYRDLLGAPPEGELPGPAPNPTGRVATADEIASFVAYLLSDEAAFITGAALAIDGGATA